MGPVPLARFDSATAMLRSVGRFLAGRDFPGPLGWRWAAPVVPAANALPGGLRRAAYGWGGFFEGRGGRAIGSARSADLAEWVVGNLPARGAPVAMVGSASGAAAHVAAALGAPWLPQTLLMLLRRGGVDVDDPRTDIERAREPAAALLAANPDLRLHQMHDPNQDRLMLRHASYFRVKWLRLPAAYERYLTTVLDEGATLLVVDCEQRWPVTRLGERHLFQSGAVGGLCPEDYLHGGQAVADLLARHGSDRRRWDYPEPDGEAPEAEWGFEPALLDDLASLAERRGWRLVRLRFPTPGALSPVVADLYRWWYRKRGMESARLVVESFALLEPWWVLRTVSVPFWTTFSVEPEAATVEAYLGTTGPFEEIGVMLFSHGVRSAGLATTERWQRVLDQATARGQWLGVDPTKHPSDFGAVTGYHTAMRRLPERAPLPAPLPFADVAGFLARHGGGRVRLR